MAACLFSSSSTTLANLGPSLSITICLLLIATFSTLSISRMIAADRHARVTVLAPKLFVTVLMSVAVIFSVAFFLLPASVVCRVRHHGRRAVSRGLLLASFIRQNVVVVGILLFYVISIVPDLLRVVNESMCWQAWTQCSSTNDACAAHHVDLFYYSVRVVLTSMMVLMCWSFRGVALYRNLFVTLGLAMFAAAMSCLWFDTWLTELRDNLRHDSHLRRRLNRTRTLIQIVDGDYDVHNSYKDTYNRTWACHTHNTTIDNLLEGYERFFYPCTFELALLVIHCVVHLYTSSEHSFSSSSTHHQQATETSALLSYRSTDSTVGGEDDVSVTSSADINVRSVGSRGHYSMLLIITTTIINVVYCLLTFLGVYAHLQYADNLFYFIHIWYEMFYRALMTSILVVGLVVAGNNSRCSSSRPSANKRQSYSGVEYLVLFTSWAPVIKSLLTIIIYSRGSSDWITVSVKTTNILGQTIAILQVAIQTVFVFYTKNLRRPELMSQSSSVAETGERYRRRSQFRAVLLVVALSDISFWVTDSFVEINMAYGYTYRCKVFYNWVPFVSFGVPIAIFYYFNCALLCLDVFLNC